MLSHVGSDDKTGPQQGLSSASGTPHQRAADIFCRVIDNYGDIGVCLRLARTLHHDHGWQIRLWIDAPEVLRRLVPSATMKNGLGELDGISLVHWHEPEPVLPPYEICIEAFACDPPASYVAQMKAGRHLWLNLEYLSAETWVTGCHLLPSPQRNGVPKYFFFPGFLKDTGGLLREPGLLTARDNWQRDPAAAAKLLAALGLTDEALAHWQQPSARLVNLFCYPHAPLAPLIATLAGATRPTLLLVPEGVAPRLSSGRQGALWIARHDFVSQKTYDRLLWSADLNIVRGEDSLVRAIWAGRPLLWHIYPQDDDAHLNKLRAWLACGSLPALIQSNMLAWNHTGTNTSSSTWAALLNGDTWESWQTSARHDSIAQATHPDLAEQLVQFCAQTLSLA